LVDGYDSRVGEQRKIRWFNDTDVISEDQGAFSSGP
jgi:hypothetical protein